MGKPWLMTQILRVSPTSTSGRHSHAHALRLGRRAPPAGERSILATLSGGLMMTTQKTLLTAEEFYLFCCQNDEWYELVAGEVVELAPPNHEHGEIAGYVVTSFNNYSRSRGIGRARVETGYTLRRGPDTVRGPDVSFVFHPRVEGRGSGFPAGAPDIPVEVVSPSDTAAEMARKVADYLAAGSQRVWVVYPLTRRAVIHRADGSVVSYGVDDVITDEELLPDFALPLSEIFE